MQEKTAVVLAGGKSSRFGSVTADVPKGMLPVAGKPLIDWVVEWFILYGIKKFVFLLGVKSDIMTEHLDDVAKKHGLQFQYSVEDMSLESAGALKRAKPLLEGLKDFYFSNGDNITNIDFRKLELSNSDVMVMASVGLRSQYGVLDIKGGRVTGFREKPTFDDIPISPGIYHFDAKIFDYLPEQEKGSLEIDVFPKLAAEGKIKVVAFPSPWFWKSVKSPKELEEATRAVLARQSFPCVTSGAKT